MSTLRLCGFFMHGGLTEKSLMMTILVEAFCSDLTLFLTRVIGMT